MLDCRVLFSKSDIDEARKLLKIVYVDEMNFQPPIINPISQRIDGDKLVDNYDDLSIWFGCYNHKDLIAVCRVRVSQPKEIEEFLELGHPVRNNLPDEYIEINRTAVLKEYRGCGSIFYLFAFMFERCRLWFGLPYVATTGIPILRNILKEGSIVIGKMKYYDDDIEEVEVYLIPDSIRAQNIALNRYFRISKI